MRREAAPPHSGPGTAAAATSTYLVAVPETRSGTATASGASDALHAYERNHSMRHPMRTTLVLLAAFTLTGLALGAVCVAWGNTPAGSTALIAPLLGGPGLLAGGWAALLLSLRHRVRGGSAAAGAVLAGAATILLGAIAWVLPVAALTVTPPSAPVRTILWTAMVPPLLAVLLGTALAALLGFRLTRLAWTAGAFAAALAGVIPFAVLPLAQILAPLLLAVPIVAPLAAARRPTGSTGSGGRLTLAVPAAVALPVLLFGGFWVGTRLALFA